MKKLNNFIHEKLKLTSSTETYLFKPQTKDELKAAIKTIISEDGEDADLNSIAYISFKIIINKQIIHISYFRCIN